MKNKVEKEVELTKRNLDFRRDASHQIVKKLTNKKYVKFKKEILLEIEKKYDRIKKRKEKIDNIHSTYRTIIDVKYNRKQKLLKLQSQIN